MKAYPVLPLRNTVLFPAQIIPIYIGREQSLKLVEDVSNLDDKTIMVVSQKQGSVELPSEFVLNRAYPNPFNPSTTIDFGVPVDGEINLSIYDVNGRLVEVIESGFISAGYHQRAWSASSYPSGVYIIRMSATGFNSTQKIVLIK